MVCFYNLSEHVSDRRAASLVCLNEDEVACRLAQVTPVGKEDLRVDDRFEVEIRRSAFRAGDIIAASGEQ